MKHFVLILTLFTLTLYTNTALSLTESETTITSAAQSGNKLIIYAHNTATSNIAGYMTVAIGYDITCGSDPVIPVQKSSTSGYSATDHEYSITKEFNAKPAGYDYWPENQACGIAATGLGVVGGSSIGVTLLGIGFNISMSGSSSNSDYTSVNMIAGCPPI